VEPHHAVKEPGTFAGERKPMDYVIAGITALGLFVYLLYALLRPERF
jgi:K+-transporting ATPase KdpF subunit